mmetsp:Transcript_14914/g.20894  ORF Transcript_14914/g.20894 Transcript_14914/m.20894 type:complete len:573 (-) Transcript_14914:350-2068(-)
MALLQLTGPYLLPPEPADNLDVKVAHDTADGLNGSGSNGSSTKSKGKKKKKKKKKNKDGQKAKEQNGEAPPMPQGNKGARSVAAETALKDIDVVAFYHAALSPAALQGRKKLEDTYAKLRSRNVGNFEIVFVSHDKTEEDFERHRKGMPWHSVPFSSNFCGTESPIAELLQMEGLQYTKDGAPRLVFFNSSGKLLSLNGWRLFDQHGEDLLRALEEEEKAQDDLSRVMSHHLGLSFGQSWARRLQAATVNFHMIMVPMSLMCWIVALFLLLIPIINIPVFVYIVWYLFFDDAETTGTREPIFRKLKIWDYFRDYFPMRLVKTVDLDPKKNYIFCYHPHGILSFGAWGAFATDALGFDKKFPGIDRRLLTLKLNFRTPLIREHLLYHGVCDVSAKSIQKILKKCPGSSVVVVVGGAQESLFTRPHTNSLYIERRRGFVREAIKAGAELVPVYGFGENDIYDTLYFEEGTWGHWVQYKLKTVFSFTVPLFHGRGLFFKKLPLFLPFRKPITIVVGKPVPVPKVSKDVDLRNSDWGRKIVDRVHEKYLAALKEVWDGHKNITPAGLNRTQSLVYD